jgi:hypothetical protein
VQVFAGHPLFAGASLAWQQTSPRRRAWVVAWMTSQRINQRQATEACLEMHFESNNFDSYIQAFRIKPILLHVNDLGTDY